MKLGFLSLPSLSTKHDTSIPIVQVKFNARLLVLRRGRQTQRKRKKAGEHNRADVADREQSDRVYISIHQCLTISHVFFLENEPYASNLYHILAMLFYSNFSTRYNYIQEICCTGIRSFFLIFRRPGLDAIYFSDFCGLWKVTTSRSKVYVIKT